MRGIFRSEADQTLAALDRSLAIVEFDLQGKILRANENFCRLMGYEPSEIVGRHHSIFADTAYAASPDYKAFWAKLQGGMFVCDEFKRIGKGGKEVYIQGSYNPVKTGSGKVYKVVKFAADITAAKSTAMANSDQIDAIGRAQAVIEFAVDGTILTANPNFLSALGYDLGEIVGRNHSIFVDPAEVQSADYQNFWARLRGGEFVADEFKRIGKGGRAVYIQASYNPIFNLDGRVTKVVKFATDVTARVTAVRRVGEVLEKMAKGDLDQRIQETFLPALDPIRISLNDSLETLRNAMRQVSRNAGAIEVGAEQIRVSADDLSRRTEQQAAALEETSAALTEITGSVKQSSKGAEEAGQLVARTKSDAERSGKIVGRAVEAMTLIAKSSDEISKIIGVIDEIAFQTNLLALNAGVEAARAGEAGRGFAVVAQEVRGLAQRSAQAAKEIKSLISTSTAQVQSGVALVGETGVALEAIVEKVAEINVHVSGIVESARSQAIGLHEINLAVATLDQGTQQNAAMVEESTAASNELAGEAVSLTELLTTFSIGDETRASGRTGSPAHDLNNRVVQAFGKVASGRR